VRWVLMLIKMLLKFITKCMLGIKCEVEWGIGELKRKWRWLMKRFDCTKPKYTILFKVIAILINFMHRW
jgi:hypothetical protein